MRRLGVWTLGFLRPELRRALAGAGWRVSPGSVACDAVGVWGRRGAARRGMLAARLTGRPLLTVEDGFLRSVAPGDRRVVSLLLDDLGAHFDAFAPSRLERLIADAAEPPPDEARRAMARLRAARISKYNHAPRLGRRPQGHVLVIDQTRGDASITHGGAGAETFARMLDAARAENPGAEIVVKTHPETAMGRKAGHFRVGRPPRGVRMFRRAVNPWDLLEGARAVYTVSSLMGFEALLAGRRVRCFGLPFYAGWGATEDELRARRRIERRDAAQIFAAAYLAYPYYCDPETGAPSDFHGAVDALIRARAAGAQPSVGRQIDMTSPPSLRTRISRNRGASASA